ncbi:MAG: hypothetical protein ABW133_08265, partial [Polyangiaceae bacterium]
MNALSGRSLGRKLAACIGFLTVIAGCGSAPDGSPSRDVDREQAAVPETTTSAPMAHQSPNDPPRTRPTTKEACDACQGLWGEHGIEAMDSCICKTNDEGRECLDGT